MSRFYFNFQQGTSFSIDEEGCEFPNVEDAYLGAVAAARDMWRELLIRREDPLACAFEVTDEKGRELFTLPFSELLDACRDRPAKPLPTPMAAALFVERAQAQAQAQLRQTRQTMSSISSTFFETRSNLSEAIRLMKALGRALER